MRQLSFIFLFVCSFFAGQANHLTGGEIIYDFISATSHSKTYKITLKLFRDDDCVDCAVMPSLVKMAIFNGANNQQFGDYILVPRTGMQQSTLSPFHACIGNPPQLKYMIGLYSFTVELPNNGLGYTVVYQTCCRTMNFMYNVIPRPGNEKPGITYVCQVPGLESINAPDNSPRFKRDISGICINTRFTFDFSATDPDGDSLVYNFVKGLDGGDSTSPFIRYDPAPPPYDSLLYSSPFTGATPMGANVSIDPHTGIISGIAPAQAGKYVVCVGVTSYRNGQPIITHRKDFMIAVSPCEYPGALLNPSYTTCDDSSLDFTNLYQSVLNETFYWDFGDPNADIDNFSTSPSPTHEFTDTGVFHIKLVVNRGTPCADSMTALANVYPGFAPAFTTNSPMCAGFPVQFHDLTTTLFGTVNSWLWDFGIRGTYDDSSSLQNPGYTYANLGSGLYIASLIVGNTKGCSARVFDTVFIVDKPSLSLTNDTLICSIDTLRLITTANPSGNVLWTPAYNLINPTSFTPLVFPRQTTTYYAAYKDAYGCPNNDSVIVNVVDSVTLSMGDDTTICRTDGIILSPNSNALKYEWTPAATLNNAFIKNPQAIPVAQFTRYRVIGRIGKCFDSSFIQIKTVPYPVLLTSADTTICSGGSAFLQASGGTYYSWTPALFLNNATIPGPVAVNPLTNISYTISVRDTFGCPKPVSHTIHVNVNKVIANAGPTDTSIVAGQALQLNATGGINYLWTTTNIPDWLNNSHISNPVSSPQDDIRYIVRVSDAAGCYDTDMIKVKFYKLPPDLYVPSAFSPNGDGTNDILKPLALGLKTVETFRVYNRFGQLLFSTSNIGIGWNGRFKGLEQEPGTYVWIAEGTDFRNKKIQRKGTVILLR
jgi:gliding motility-associated-like protein